MDNNKEKTFIATNLKYLRDLNNKSLSDVAKVCDKSDVAIHYWENGTREPSAVDIAKLSNYYDVTIDDLLSKDLRFNNENENNKKDSKTEALLNAYNGLSDIDKEWVNNIVIERRKLIDKQEENKGV